MFMYSYSYGYVFLLLCMFRSAYSASLFCSVYECVLYNCHQVSTHLQVTSMSYHIITTTLVHCTKCFALLHGFSNNTFSSKLARHACCPINTQCAILFPATDETRHCDIRPILYYLWMVRYDKIFYKCMEDTALSVYLYFKQTES
jgi:hypothetical protein